MTRQNIEIAEISHHGFENVYNRQKGNVAVEVGRLVKKAGNFRPRNWVNTRNSKVSCLKQ